MRNVFGLTWSCWCWRAQPGWRRTGRTGAAPRTTASAPKKGCPIRGAPPVPISRATGDAGQRARSRRMTSTRPARRPAPGRWRRQPGPAPRPHRVRQHRDQERRVEAAAAGLQRLDADHLGRHDLPERRHRDQHRRARVVGGRSQQAGGAAGSGRSPTPTTWSASRTCRRRRRSPTASTSG